MNNKNYFEDIICARATPPGNSAVALIRVSGKNSWKLLDNFFIPLNDKSNFKSHRVYFGKIIINDETIDNVLVLTFQENKSYTGEESFEISCHGSEVIVSLILKYMTSIGIRLAEPGEFTKRAFLNGKIDLTEAESIMDLINSNTKKSALIAVRQLSGLLSRIVIDINDMIADLLAEVEVFIDYPEEDISVDSDKWNNLIDEIIKRIDDLIKGFNRGKYFRTGIESVICGKTNSGKSTLFNFLINEDKAIVSDIHGTTRDYIDGLINIEGFAVRLYDTAGLRETNDPIEKEGTKRAVQLMNNSDIILYIVSGIDGLTNEDIENIKSIDKEKKILFIINKIDECKDVEGIINKVNKEFNSFFNKFNYVKMSALNRMGLEDFNINFLKLLTDDNQIETGDPLITNERHAFLLKEALLNLNQSKERLYDQALDLFAFDLREALNRLGEITGQITSDDVINRIFKNFCVGK